jgi:hypothetical protein
VKTTVRRLGRALRLQPPWNLILWGGALQMVVTPIAFYPFAKALCLAADLVFRPGRPEDFAG